MSSGVHIRRFATGLLRLAARLAPHENSEWPQAMVAELDFIDSHWSAVFWALGASRVLAKRALFSLVSGRKRQAVPFQAELLSSEGFMKKASLVTTGACVFGVLLLLIAPEFRQALQVSLSAWHDVFHGGADRSQPELDVLAKRAWGAHDAEGLAFAAVRVEDDGKSASWANGAVHLDPKLTWIYGVVAVRHPANPEIKNWLPKLEIWDPQNALFHLIKAECIDIEYLNKRTAPLEEKDPTWLNAMGAAFDSLKFDDYLDRLRALDRNVVQRYAFIDAAEIVFDGYGDGWPTYAFQDTHRFANTFLRAGQELEMHGHQQAAAGKYWRVARFGQMMNIGAHSEYGGWIGSDLQRGAYERLRAQFEKSGNQQEGALMTYLIEQFRREEENRRSRFGDVFSTHEVAAWNASVVRAAGLLMVVFSGVIGVLMLAAAGRRLQRRSISSRANQLMRRLSFGAALALLISAITLGVTYRPYSRMVDSFIRSGDTSQMSELVSFLARAHSLPGTWGTNMNFTVDFWAAITWICAISLVVVLLPGALRLARTAREG